MALNIITAKFCSGSTQTWTEEAWQYDYGQVLQFDGLDLPDAYQVHFSNTPMTGETITQIGGADGVTVPDQFFTGGETIYAWVYLHEGEDDGETVYMVTIPVKKRPQPSDDVPTPVEQSAIDQAIAALNIAVEKAEDAIEHYPTIIDGTWHVWDVTEEEYVDTGVQAQGQPGADGQDGTDGQDGQDGFSPVITVTDITGGHRVTITDAEGTQSFDVLDGSGAPAFYGICDSSYGSLTKVVPCDGFELVEGARIIVTFTASSDTGITTGQLKLNVNSTGAKNIKYRNSITTFYSYSDRFCDYKTCEFVYDGTYYIVVGDFDTDTKYYQMTQSEADTGTSVTGRLISAKVLHNAIQNAGGGVTVDDELSTTSENPVQNKVITEALNDVNEDISQLTTYLNTESVGSTNLWNKNASQVGYLHKNGNVYTGGTYDDFVYGSVGNVSQGDVLNFYKLTSGNVTTCTVQFVVCYDANGTVMSDAGTSSVTTFIVPQGVASVKITIRGDQSPDAMALKNNASAPSGYIPYTEPSTAYVASSEFIHEAYTQEAQDVTSKVDAIYTADAEDQGKVLQAKTVVNGKVTEWDFVNSGGSPSGDYVTTDLMRKCELKEFPKSENLWDNEHKHPGWFHQNGNIYDYAGFYYWNIGAVSEGDVIDCYYENNGSVLNQTMYAVVCLDSNGNTMPSVSTASVTSFTVPSGVSEVVVTINSPYEKTMIVKNIERPTEFIPYYEAYTCYVATPDFIHDAITGDLLLNVPEKIYAVVGIECNIYFENITEEWEKYHWEVACTKGKQMKRCYTITPTSGDVGEYTLTIRAYVDWRTYKEVTATLVIASANAANNVSIIVLGDSTTDNGMAVTKIHTDFESASTAVSTLGTRGTSPNNHEGRSGWKASDYLTVQSRDGVNNPFYNPSTSTFDASYYFANSGVSVPDWFFINLGVNDVFGYVSDEEFAPWIPRILGYYDTIITSLHSAAPNMKIGVCITIPPNDSQDAFGKDYACGQNRDRCKRNNLLWVDALIAEYDGRTDEGIYLVPIHCNLDTVNNMGMESIPVNARNSTTYQSPTANGGVHPVESGYWQIADVYTAFLKANT